MHSKLTQGAVRAQIHPSPGTDVSGKPVDLGWTTQRVQLTWQPLHRVGIVTLGVLYAVLLVAVLNWTIAPQFGYAGFEYTPIKELDYFIWVWSLVALGALVLPIRLFRPSQFFVWLLYLAVYVPAIVVPPYSSGLRNDYALMQGVLFLSMIVLAFAGLLPAIKLPTLNIPMKLFVGGLVLYSALVMAWLMLRVGVPTSLPSIINPYEQRAAYGAALAATGPVLYLISWQTTVINPLLIVVGLVKRRTLIFLLGIGLNVLMYAMAGHKSDLFASALVIAIYMLITFAPSVRSLLFAGGAVGIVLISQLLYLAANWIVPVSLGVRRMLLVPGLLTGFYFEYFSSEGYSQHFGPLSMLFNPVEFELNIPRTIGLEFFGDSSIAANVNFFADSFGAAGYLGLMFATLIVAVTLWIMDSLSVSRPARVAVPIFVMSLFSLLNSALFTSLLTHGILFSMLLVWLIPLASTTEEPEHVVGHYSSGSEMLTRDDASSSAGTVGTSMFRGPVAL